MPPRRSREARPGGASPLPARLCGARPRRPGGGAHPRSGDGASCAARAGLAPGREPERGCPGRARARHGVRHAPANPPQGERVRSRADARGCCGTAGVQPARKLASGGGGRSCRVRLPRCLLRRQPHGISRQLQRLAAVPHGARGGVPEPGRARCVPVLPRCHLLLKEVEPLCVLFVALSGSGEQPRPGAQRRDAGRRRPERRGCGRGRGGAIRVAGYGGDVEMPATVLAAGGLRLRPRRSVLETVTSGDGESHFHGRG
mmetsp:Transcript_18589/g.60600  ORF Transcript_18589/g.60600 Transcript_18589/m.60600 type:complete len:259 (+) Transcript_18589:723-1499(+)